VIGAGLVLIGIALLIVEGHIPGFGGPGAIGFVAVIAGVLVLLDAGTILELPRGIIIALCVLGAIFVPVAIVLIQRAKRVPPQLPPGVLGSEGIATSDIDPFGTVRVRAEDWSAETDAGRIEAGARIRVVGEKGLKLLVDRY
jgi:membrane-bound ClpP family serine protease